MNKLITKKDFAKKLTDKVVVSGEEKRPQVTTVVGFKGFLNLLSQFVTVGGDFV